MYRAYLERNDYIGFSLEDFLGLRKLDLECAEEWEKEDDTDGPYLGAMTLFCDSILPEVVGKVAMRKGVTKMRISEFVTVTDEAFALLVLENIWDTWWNTPLDELKAGAGVDEKGKRKVRAGKYTGDWRRAGRHQGWSKEGLERMNKLIKLVEKDREEYGDKWESWYLKRRQEKQRGKKVKRSDVTAEEREPVVDELEDIPDSEGEE